MANIFVHESLNQIKNDIHQFISAYQHKGKFFKDLENWLPAQSEQANILLLKANCGFQLDEMKDQVEIIEVDLEGIESSSLFPEPNSLPKESTLFIKVKDLEKVFKEFIPLVIFERDFNTHEGHLAIAKKNLKKLYSSIQQGESRKPLKKVLDELSVFLERILLASDEKELTAKISSWDKESHLFEMINLSPSYEEREDYKNDILSMIFRLESFRFIILKVNEAYERDNDIIRFFTYKTLYSFYKRSLFLKELSDRSQLWIDIWDHLPFPSALISDEGEFLHYNSSFLSLNLVDAKAIEWKDGVGIEVHKEKYHLKKIKISSAPDCYLIIFFEQKQIDGSEENYHLGIITSSVAHELKNPLAGILAAVSLLELDEWEVEDAKAIQEIKKSTLRSKDLVETFLGFSRTESAESFPLKGMNIQKSIDQALNLIKSRMVETNIKINIESNFKQENHSLTIQPSILVMVLYLIFSELLTYYGHHMLLTLQEPKSDHIITLKLKLAGSLKMQIDPNFDFKGLLESQLIKHLLKIEGADLKIIDGQLSIEQGLA